MDGSGPTARALLALEVLQDSPGVTARRLAERLGVTERAVRRYVTVLRDAGIPIESTTGPYGGYRLGRGTRLPPLMLSAAEALGLVMAVLEARPSAVGGADPVGSAIGKIVRVLPRSVAESVAALRQVSTSGTGSGSPSPDPGTTAVLVRAAESRHRVRITYRLSRDRVIEIDPWAVSVWRGRWYLLGWSLTSDARRVYRVDRVAEVEVLTETFVPPDDLDPLAAIEDQMSSGWEHEVEIEIEAPPEQVAQWLPRSLGRLEPLEGGRTRLVGSTGDAWWFVPHLVAIRAPYRVVRPAELREAARQLGSLLTRAGAEP